MKKKDKQVIIDYANSLSDDELEKEYYNCVLSCLGSECERMYELGYDIIDILEREKFEKFNQERCVILESLCLKRGIKLWND